MERSKAKEAFVYLSAVREAQERYQGLQGVYAADPFDLDVMMLTPKHFKVGAVSAGSTKSLQNSWTLTLTRTGPSSGYGAYTVSFTNEGFDSSSSTIPVAIIPLGN
jgi:hypothetical protein